MNGKRKKRLFWDMRFLILLMFLLVPSTIVAQMASPNFQIRTTLLNTGGGHESSTNFGMQNSTGQSTPTGIYQSQNFALFAGFQSSTLEEFVLPTFQRGDVNGDMGINVLDVVTTVNHILGTVPVTGDALERADCNADGEVDVLDALGIVNVILGIGECEP